MKMILAWMISMQNKSSQVKPPQEVINNKHNLPGFSGGNRKNNFQNKKDDYGLDDFDDYNDSFENVSKPKEEHASQFSDKVNPFPSPGFSKDIEKKVRPERTSGIDIQGMKRMNDKLENSSDFGDYDDDLSNLNKIPTPNINSRKIPQKDSPKINKQSSKGKAKPVPNIKKFKAEVIESKDKPITERTGPTADPIPEKQNLRLDTEQKNRFQKKIEKESRDYSNNDSEDAKPQNKEVFLTQQLQNESSEEGTRFNKDFSERNPPKATIKKKASMNSMSNYQEEDAEELYNENTHLIAQLSEFTSQMDDRMVLLRKVKKVDKDLERPNSALNSKKVKLNAMTRKLKLIRTDIENMNRIIDNSYKLDSVVERENEFSEQEMILAQQKLKLKDFTKAIKDQKKHIREIERVENAEGKANQINHTFTEAKNKVRLLKKKFTEEDKILRDLHEEVQIMKDRSRKIKDYVMEK